jgi:hypothetical protein
MTPQVISAKLQALTGLGQALFSGRKRKEREFENYTNQLTPNASITDYYNKALSRYDANAYNSAAYRQGQQNIGSNLATGISSLQNRKSALSGVSNLVANANRAALSNVANAENIQGANLSRLGQAAGTEASNQNRITDMKYNLKAMKAGQAATTQNMGMKNIFGGLSNLAYSFGEDGEDDGSKKKPQLPFKLSNQVYMR